MTKAQPKTPATRHPAALLMQIRTWHTYLGMLIAPAVIFFAATGLLQVYSLHEAHPGYTPPPLVEKLGMVHKNQRFALGRHGPPPSAALAAGPSAGQARPADGPPTGRARASNPATGLLKAFFAAVSVALIFSTGTGVWMALRQPLRRRTYILLLSVGALVPVVLAVLSA
ncbi:MAG: hypothetical protein P4L73_04725 [Caulobacteraceae bacterium]|nr:hypothetical protein [Caulobacteraceae bacterium]